MTQRAYKIAAPATFRHKVRFRTSQALAHTHRFDMYVMDSKSVIATTMENGPATRLSHVLWEVIIGRRAAFCAGN
jgi:hypothetical protein